MKTLPVLLLSFMLLSFSALAQKKNVMIMEIKQEIDPRMLNLLCNMQKKQKLIS
jgi:membrane-bound ClpP family serine protease